MSGISFVIPAYNAEKMLTEAVASILDGNFEDGDEIIIVNDASQDATLEIAEFLSRRHQPNIRVINNIQNKGCPASRNIGIAEARNELIFNLDADNILAPHSVQLLKKVLIQKQADVAAFGEYRYFKTTPKMITHIWKCRPGLFMLADLFAGHINPAPGGNFLYRKASWQLVGGYWEYGKGLHEAWGFSLKLLMHGVKFIVVPGSFYYHRYSHESLFVREHKNIDAEVKITEAFIRPARNLLDDASQAYIAREPRWYKKLEQRPLRLKDGSVGKNGTITQKSLLKSLAIRFKSMLRRNENL